MRQQKVPERRSDRNIKASVSIKQARILPVLFKSLLRDDKHGNLRSIFGLIENLFSDKIARFEPRNDCFSVELGLSIAGVGNVEFEDLTGAEEGSEGEEDLSVFSFAGDCADGSDVDGDFAELLAFHGVNVHGGLDVLEEFDDKVI